MRFWLAHGRKRKSFFLILGAKAAAAAEANGFMSLDKMNFTFFPPWKSRMNGAIATCKNIL
jgi:hypothetical protein